MQLQELQQLYAYLPQVSALANTLSEDGVKTVFLEGLLASAAPMVFSALATKQGHTMLFIMQDADEAGYLYHDLTQVMGSNQVLFFPSSYRRAIKYGQRDAASEILRTETLSAISRRGEFLGSSDNSFDSEKQKESASSASSASEKLVSDELQATSDEMQAALSSTLLSEASLLHSFTPFKKG